MTRTSRKVAIVARAGTHRLAPFFDPGYEIWGMPWIRYPRVDRAFEIHSEQMIAESEESWFTQQAWLPDFLEEHPKAEVWCDPSRKHRFPRSREYPLEAVQRFVGESVLENSVCYMIALALYERRPAIELYGVHLLAGPEADMARHAVAYLIGFGRGLGIQIDPVPGSPLLMSNFVAGRYGARGGEGAVRPKFFTNAGVLFYEESMCEQ